MKKILLFLLLFGVAQANHGSHKTHPKLSKHPKHTVIKTAKKYLGTRYKFGGTTKRGIDCSAFTQKVLKAHGKKIPRTANQQASAGVHVDRKNLQPGDLVFFKNTDRRKTISHVGIFIGGDKFIHASSGAKRVTISRLSKKFYRVHYAGARRV